MHMLEHALSPIGWELLKLLPPYDPAEGVKLSDGLRKRGIDPEIVAAVMAQRQLRYEARGKLGEIAADLVFTRDGLEQATRLVVAATHAQRFRDAGATKVADLGCGLGIDSYAMAGLGLSVTAVDLDPQHAAAAKVNLRFFNDAEVCCADATTFNAAGFDGIFADPARRSGGRRIMDPNRWSPALSTVLGWADNVSMLGCKVAPGIDHAYIPSGWHAQWTSVDGELVEAALWSPPLASEGAGRSAYIISDGQGHVIQADHTDPGVAALEPGNWLIDPDSAIIRSGALGALAKQLGAHTIHPQIAYLACCAPAPKWAGSSFKVIEIVPLKAKLIAAAISSVALELGGYFNAVEILKRGAQIEPSALRAQITASRHWKTATGNNGRALGAVSVILTRIGKRHGAIIAIRS